MEKIITLALDAMGGDHAPASVVEGAHIAFRKHPNLRFQFFGDEAKVAPLLNQYPALKAQSEIFHTEDHVAADAKPSVALRQGTKSSMRLAINAVKDGTADGTVSSGNTGALMAMSKLVLRMLPKIDRPAICSTLPTVKDRCVMLDMGANVECDAKGLCQFAVMGDAFARTVLGVSSPSLGLLNIGEEEIKGNGMLKEAYQRLRETQSLNFHGFVEGTDIGKGTVDVVVTDGFTGNIALKTLEGTARFTTERLKMAFKSSLLGKIGYLVARPALKHFQQSMDPRSHNGGVFIGLNGITVKSHGNADGIAFSVAIEMAYELIKDDVNGKIIDELHRAHLDEPMPETPTEQAM